MPPLYAAFKLFLLPMLLLLPFFLLALNPPIRTNSQNDAANIERPVRAVPSPSPTELNRGIALAGHYLLQACNSDGRFVYRINAASGRQTRSYNIIRHAGAIYALAMLNQSHPDDNIVKTMIRAAEFLRKNYIARGPQRDQLAVWSRPVSEHSPTYFPVAELGASGLGLVALTEVNKAKPGAIPLADLEALGRFLLFLQRDDGGFISKFIEETGLVRNWESLYYPGEAALGLISLYKEDHSLAWLVAAGKALGYLAAARAPLKTVPADHWALIATAELLPYVDRVSFTVSREELIRHATQVCNSILHQQIEGSSDTALDGAFDPSGRTTPAATRLEGLLASLEFLPTGELSGKIEAATARGVTFLLRTQIGSGLYAGGIPAAAVPGALHSSDVRIDYVQHVLCAWLRYQKIFQSRIIGDAKTGP